MLMDQEVPQESVVVKSSVTPPNISGKCTVRIVGTTDLRLK